MNPVRLAICLVAVTVAIAFAQAPWGFREGRVAPRFAPPSMPDGNFTFCRIMYERVRTEAMGMGWVTDYPYAEINLMTRLSELTKTPVSRDERGQPNHWVVRLTDPALFNCAFTMASDVGTIGLTPAEREGLRQYLLKGGFLWVDLGHRRLESLELRDRKRPASVGVSNRRRPLHRSRVQDPDERGSRAADHEHPVLAIGRREYHLRAR
jgi:hypothetical protein